MQIDYHCEPRDLAAGVKPVNEDIRAITDWAADLGLVLNKDKIKSIIVSTLRFIADISFDVLPSVVVGRVSIPFFY